MKRFLIILTVILLSVTAVDAADCPLCPKSFITKNSQEKLIRNILKQYVKYANNYDYDNLITLYSPNYVNADGLTKEIYFKLIKTTWQTYPDIKYEFKIKNINVTGSTAIAEVEESAYALSVAPDNGTLKSFANSVYYLEKNNGSWKIVSDYIVNEKTLLYFGEAKNALILINAPNQVMANNEYTVSLTVIPPKGNLVIASIGNEKITYPQKNAKEVFRKMPDDMILERLFIANTDNINEYAVASIGLTKATIQPDKKIKVEISGLAYAMARVNVVPINKFIEVEKNEVKTK